MNRDYSYGSGYFGKWIKDDFGLPAYEYICDQINDPKAKSVVHEGWIPFSDTNHLHQIGNDRLIGIVSNYGYVQIRQDEGSPKFLNDYDPTRYQFAGGFGYLVDDGGTTLSTLFTENQNSLKRIFGMGYYRKNISKNNLTVDQVIFTPFGNDPLVISQLTITNHRDKQVDARWIEYWSCFEHQFSYRSFMRSVTGKLTAPELRRNISDCFSHSFSIIKRKGLLVKKKFNGFPFKDKLAWGFMQIYLHFKGKHLTGGRVKSPVKETMMEDLTPPDTFLVSLDSPVDGFCTNSRRFFCSGGIESPVGLKNKLNPEIYPHDDRTGLFLERHISLQPNESKVLYFTYGYLPEGFILDKLLEKYETNPSKLLEESCNKWNTGRPSFRIPDEPWIDREIHWSYYYLRSNLTYDSFFKENILSQGQYYQYCVGFQGAARDPLQHAFPLIFGDEKTRNYVKNILRYTLKEVQPDGAIPYGIVGAGHIMPAPFTPSDQEMWLLWLATEYVLSSKDLDFLDEEIPTYPLYGKNAGRSTVKELLAKCYHHFTNMSGTGKHGLQKILNGDWNDLVVHGYAPDEYHAKIIEQGESVLNAAMASYVLDYYSQLLTEIGDEELATDAFRKAYEQRKAIQKQWCTKGYFKRAWLTEELGWVGAGKEMWLEPQPWAIIGGAADSEQRQQLIRYIDEHVRKPSKIGAMLIDKGIKKTSKEQILGSDAPDGIGTNAGIWSSINGTLIWALSLVDRRLALDEWKKNTFARHAEEYPDIWYGIWSGPDSFNSELSRYPGQTVSDRALTPDDSTKEYEKAISLFNVAVTDFPVCCMHPHAWPIYNISHLIGIKFTTGGLYFTPRLPLEEYKFSTPLLGFEKTKEGYSGWYAPLGAGEWTITFEFPDEETAKSFTSLVINEQKGEITRIDNKLIWIGNSSKKQPHTWNLKK